MYELDRVRNNLQVDPHLTIWGWEIPLYLFLGGLTAGLMILAAVLRLRGGDDEKPRWERWLPFAAPALISLGMLALFIDLAHREHVWRFYLALRVTSPMSWGAWILIAIYPATLLLGLQGLRDDEVEALAGWAPVRALRLAGLLRWARALSLSSARALWWSNIVLGAGLGTYTGLLLGTLAARPAWNSVVLGPLFLVSGLSTGAALMMLFPVGERTHHALRRWDVTAILVEILLLGLFFLSLASSAGPAGDSALALFLGGRFTAPFWALVVVGGLSVPLVLELVEARRGLRPTLMAPALILVGGLSLRWILVAAGQAA
jgi:formate-dependent nitrite reductase membrane component NrfD